MLNPDGNFEYLKAMTDSGNKDATLDELMTAYGKDVWNYIFSMTRKRELTDDLTQDVFLKVYRNLFSFRGESSVKTWIMSIARNAVVDYRRSAYFRRVTLVEYFSPASGATEASAEQEAMKTEAVSQIWDLVMQLPIKYREVIVLYAHHQLSMNEIANVLDVSEGTVKSRLFHARAKLGKLKERLGDGTN